MNIHRNRGGIHELWGSTDSARQCMGPVAKSSEEYEGVDGDGGHSQVEAAACPHKRKTQQKVFIFHCYLLHQSQINSGGFSAAFPSQLGAHSRFAPGLFYVNKATKLMSNVSACSFPLLTSLRRGVRLEHSNSQLSEAGQVVEICGLQGWARVCFHMSSAL